MVGQGKSAQPIYVLPVESVSDNPSRISLSGVMVYFWRSRYWIVVSAILGLAAGIAIDLVSTRIFHAETLISAAQQDRSGPVLGGLASQIGSFASLAGISLNGSNTLRTEALAVLSSRGFVGTFIQRHNLMPILYSKIWDPSTKGWTVSDPEKIPTLSRAVLYFTTRVMAIQEDRKTGLISVSVDWKDPTIAANWANALVADLNSSFRNRALQESSQNIDYLNHILRKENVSDTERQAIYALIEQQIATAMLANVRTDFAFKVLDFAVPPDEDRYVVPNLWVLIGSGIGSFIVVGLVARFIYDRWLIPLMLRRRNWNSK